MVLEGVVGRRWELRVRLAAVGAMARGLGEEVGMMVLLLWVFLCVVYFCCCCWAIPII